MAASQPGPHCKALSKTKAKRAREGLGTPLFLLQTTPCLLHACGYLPPISIVHLRLQQGARWFACPSHSCLLIQLLIHYMGTSTLSASAEPRTLCLKCPGELHQQNEPHGPAPSAKKSAALSVHVPHSFLEAMTLRCSQGKAEQTVSVPDVGSLVTKRRAGLSL